MTRTSRLDLGSGSDADPVYQWDIKRKLYKTVEAASCAFTRPFIFDPIRNAF